MTPDLVNSWLWSEERVECVRTLGGEPTYVIEGDPHNLRGVTHFLSTPPPPGMLVLPQGARVQHIGVPDNIVCSLGGLSDLLVVPSAHVVFVGPNPFSAANLRDSFEEFLTRLTTRPLPTAGDPAPSTRRLLVDSSRRERLMLLRDEHFGRCPYPFDPLRPLCDDPQRRVAFASLGTTPENSFTLSSPPHQLQELCFLPLSEAFGRSAFNRVVESRFTPFPDAEYEPKMVNVVTHDGTYGPPRRVERAFLVSMRDFRLRLGTKLIIFLAAPALRLAHFLLARTVLA
jgi:hypothetical protein